MYISVDVDICICVYRCMYISIYVYIKKKICFRLFAMHLVEYNLSILFS